VITTLATAAVDRFRDVIVRRLGLQFDDVRAASLNDVLRRRVDATSTGVDEYLARLEAETWRDELIALGQELTVAETYFFRHVEQYRAFAETALPDRVRWCESTGARVSIVSAGCASGEEPYSLAIAVRDTLGHRADATSILGVDINPTMLEKAARGRCSAWSLRDTPLEIQRRWFRSDGRDWVLDESVRRAVRFAVCNLADVDGEVWRPHAHDIVFCRNVLMYFSPASARAVVARIERSLRPGGYLFLGHAETLRGLSNDFHLRHTHGTFYYQTRDDAEARPARDAGEAQRMPPRSGQSDLIGASTWASTWLDTIRQASERIQLLADPHRRRPAPANTASGPMRAQQQMGLALKFLGEERFADALAVVQELPETSESDAEVLLLRAVLLTHCGPLAAAEQACQRLLEVNELSAEAHYLLALCREGVGDQAGSLYHDQVAVYLDPSFAMAHLHLGLLARRVRDVATARRELEQAVALLEREDASRLLLFGGGFAREALLSLCRAELGRGDRS
jgi:chemotaxis protein methyltransferase CheR